LEKELKGEKWVYRDALSVGNQEEEARERTS
jgi:hypothetical protein